MAPVIISSYCCVWSMIGLWPREPLLSGGSEGQGVGQGAKCSVHMQGQRLQWVTGHPGEAEEE